MKKTLLFVLLSWSFTEHSSASSSDVDNYSYVITESQKSWGLKGSVEIDWLNLLLKQGHPDPVTQDWV